MRWGPERLKKSIVQAVYKGLNPVLPTGQPRRTASAYCVGDTGLSSIKGVAWQKNASSSSGASSGSTQALGVSGNFAFIGVPHENDAASRAARLVFRARQGARVAGQIHSLEFRLA